MSSKYKKKKTIKLILSILALIALIVIIVLFYLNNPKDKKIVKYVEDLLEVKIDRYITSGKGTIKDNNYIDAKFEVKGYDVDKFKRELDGKMNLYELTSDVYLNKYMEKAKSYAKEMNIDTFYQLTLDGRDIVGILCEDNGQYYFLIIG